MENLNRLADLSFLKYDDLYPYFALTYDFHPETWSVPEKKTFLKAGNKYLMAGNMLVNINSVTYDE